MGATREEKLRAIYGSRGDEWRSISRDMAERGRPDLALQAQLMAAQADREDEFRAGVSDKDQRQTAR